MASLRLLDRAGAISELQEQVTFALCIGPDGIAFLRSARLGLNANRPGTRIEAYRADAVYREGGREVTADAKNKLITDTYRRKRTWMEALGRPITELHKPETRKGRR